MDVIQTMAKDPAWLISTLRATVDSFHEPCRMAAYVLLAQVAEVEAVAALELARAGDAAAIAPYVRATMAADTAEPLIEAARTSPIKRRAQPSPQPAAADLDHPVSSPPVTLIRSRLDGRTNRWLELATHSRPTPRPPTKSSSPRSPPPAPITGGALPTDEECLVTQRLG